MLRLFEYFNEQLGLKVLENALFTIDGVHLSKSEAHRAEGNLNMMLLCPLIQNDHLKSFV